MEKLMRALTIEDENNNPNRRAAVPRTSTTTGATASPSAATKVAPASTSTAKATASTSEATASASTPKKVAPASTSAPKPPASTSAATKVAPASTSAATKVAPASTSAPKPPASTSAATKVAPASTSAATKVAPASTSAATKVAPASTSAPTKVAPTSTSEATALTSTPIQVAPASTSTATSSPLRPIRKATRSKSFFAAIMAIKNLAIESENAVTISLEQLVQYLEAINNGPAMLMQPAKLLLDCREVYRVLSNTKMIPEHQTWYYFQVVEGFLSRAVSLHPEVRQMVISTIMNLFYADSANPAMRPGAYSALMLVIFDAPNSEMANSVTAFVDGSINKSDFASLENCLACWFRWCIEWSNCAVPIGQFIVCFMRVLEARQRYDILMMVSMFYIEQMFMMLGDPMGLRRSVSEVLFHVLSCCRYSIPVMDKIAFHVPHVLACLAADSSQWSRQLLQNVVDILSVMVYNMTVEDNRPPDEVDTTTPEEGDGGENADDNMGDPNAVKKPPPERIKYREKYAEVIRNLERHMASGTCPYLTNVPWQTNDPDELLEEPRPQTKAGLHNLGNTCYMNSVIQALLATKQFSNAVILYKDNTPYWQQLCHLFTLMHHSLSCKLNPLELFQVIKPPYFITNSQHDSSEFLVYMFETLQCYEYHSLQGFDYNNPPPRILPTVNSVSYTVDEDWPRAGASGSGHRSASPMPGSSSGATGSKRAYSGGIDMPLKKRIRKEPKDKPGKCKNKNKPRQCDSILDQLFGGIMVTRLQCAECLHTSFSRDVFRDLQLGFPEKLENKRLSVQYLIEYYCSEERLFGANQYRCPICKTLVDAERSCLIDIPPKYLIIVLKNFQYEPKLQVHAKLMHQMHYDMEITLPIKSNNEQDRPQYNLYAGIVHSGNTLDSGHYFTLAHDGNQWHEYNDELVTVTTEHEINSLTHACTPYILFYRRSDVLEPAPPTFQELCPSLRQMIESHHKHVVDVVTQYKSRGTTKP